jgi:glucose-1-phosphate thymidylyltransferase
MKAIILAWWFATRLWPLTEKRAKPLLLLNNKEVISHIIEKIPEKIKTQNLEKNIEIVIYTNAAFKNDFEEYLEENKLNKNFKNKKISVEIEDSYWDDSKRWALWATADLIEKEEINEDIFLITWDNYFWFDFKKFEEKISENPNNPLIASYDFWIENIEKAKWFWVIVPDEKNKNIVKKFQEKPINPESSLISTWFYFLPWKILKDLIVYSKIHPDNIWWVFEYLLEKWQEINIFTFWWKNKSWREELWFDIWSFQDLIESHKILQQKNFFWDDEKILNKNIIENKNFLNQKNFFWKNVKIFNSKIENCIIYDNCEIKDCELKNCVIDQNCKIENLELYWKILRENSEIN